MQATSKFDANRAAAAYQGKDEMRELSADVQKMVLWLFSEVVQKGGKLTYTDAVLPELNVSTDFNFSQTNAEQPIVELTVEEPGDDGWRVRFLLIKILGEELPKIYPQMYKDSDWGLVHVLSWCQSNENEPDLLQPSKDYNHIVTVAGTRIRDAWRRRRNQLPILKK